MNKPRFALVPFWIGLLFAFSLASGATWSLMKVLNTHLFAEVASTAWNMEGTLFRIWAFAVPLGSLLAVIGALLYVKANRAFIWILGVVFPVIVVTTIMVFSTRYYPGGFYGVGGSLILLLFFSLVWLWMKKYAGQGPQERVAGSLKLVGYLFWINASWYLCGDTAKLHLKAFEGTSVPSPTETMVFLVLGWFFVTLGEYRSVRVDQEQLGTGEST
jgi:hypothetical protein